MEGPKIWNAILSLLRKQLSLSTFKTWFAGSFVLEHKRNQEKNLLIVAVKNNFIKEQIEARYLPVIAQIIAQKKIESTEIIFVVSRKETTQNKADEPIFSGIPRSLINNTRKANTLNPDHSFENFVVGPSNNLAYLAAKQVSGSLGSVYNPLLLYGPTGVGKTHLLQAIGNQVLNNVKEAKVLYASCEKFTNDYLDSLSNKTQAIFRDKYRNLDLLLIDDIQFLAGKESTQDEFFYTFNELHLSGRQIVIVSDRRPQELGRLKERLVSRLVGGMAADIGLPDFEMRSAILKAKCAQRGVELDGAIIAYIAEFCQYGARELEGILVSALPIIKLSSGRIGLEEIKTLVSKNHALPTVKPTPEKIIQKVSDYFKLSPDALCGPSRKAALVLPRQILMYFLRKELNLPLEQIGQFIGGRDHSTVLYGIEKVEKIIPNNRIKHDDILRIRSFFHSN